MGIFLPQDRHFDRVKGADIKHADALSRLRFENESSQEEECDTLLSVHSVTFQQSVLSNAQISAEILRDSFLQRIMWHVTSGNWRNCSQAEQPFRLKRDKLTIEFGVLYCGSRVFVPSRLRRKAFVV